MSKYTEFFNLFEWDPINDADEEFNIEKALNENWEKIDLKLKTYINNVDKKIQDFDVENDDFEESINQEILNFKTEVNNQMENLLNNFKRQDFEEFKNEINETVTNISKQFSDLQTKIDEEIENLKNKFLPPGGKKGQVLAKNSDNDDDVIWKDISSGEIEINKYYMKISEKIPANSEMELPFYYKVGANVLDVYYLGEKLIKDTLEVEGNYQEVGEDGDISNKIIVGWDVDEETEDDDSYFEFVVRGKYEGSDL